MATIKQQRVIKKLVENGGNVSCAMRDVGYSEATVNNPSNLTNSKGYREILADSGLTDTFVIQNLVSDIKRKPLRRLGELTLASDLLGLRKRGLIIEESNSQNDRDIRSLEIEKEQSRIFEAYLKAKLMGRQSVEIQIPNASIPI